MKTRFTPATLSNTAAKKALEHRSEPEFVHAIGAIGQLSSLYDSLMILHSTPDPSRTKAARAQRYKQQHEAALAKAQTMMRTVFGNMSSIAEAAKAKAEDKAGIHEPLSEALAAELRGALRGLSEKERNAAIMSAAQHGEVAILKAVKQTPSALLIGPVSVPVDQVMSDFVDAQSPEYRQIRDDVESAQNHFEFALETFIKETKKLRDPVLESEGEKQAKEIKEAESQLQEVG